MKNWKKNAVVASILVFVCAGIYLNWSYSQSQETINLTDTLNQEKILGSSTLVMSQNNPAVDAAQEDLTALSQENTDYFAAIRLSRQQSRDSAITTLREAMSYGEDGESSSASAVYRYGSLRPCHRWAWAISVSKTVSLAGQVFCAGKDRE